MKYFFLLGNNPSLSVAELSAKIPHIKNAKLHNNNIFVFETDSTFNAGFLIKQLGGTIKIGEIDSETSRYNPEKIQKEVKKLIHPGEGKFKFGISYYGNSKFSDKFLGMKIKNHLKDQGVSCRWVISKEPTLSSVVVTQNKLTTRGLEVALIEDGHKLLVGKTLAVQDFKSLSFRDYNRPATDSASGMLPPKLAQIMINLAKTEEHSVLLDPFCGSGTVLMEALIMRTKKVYGSDISEKAVKDTLQNTEWICRKFNVENPDYTIIEKSSTKISEYLEPNTIDKIVTEPYLGPQKGSHDIKKVRKELEDLYSETIQEFKKVLKPSGIVVMLWPAFNTSKEGKMTNTTSQNAELSFITPDYSGFKIVNPIPQQLRSNKITTSARNTLIYSREGQRVHREIVILKQIQAETEDLSSETSLQEEEIK